MNRSKKTPVMKSLSPQATKTQKAALQLLKKEEINAKKSRLECLFVQQFVGKYGSKNANSEINSIIRKAVSDFLNSYTNMSEAEKMVDTLESKIVDFVHNWKKERKLMKDREIEKMKQNNQKNSSKSNLHNSNESTYIPENQWPVINTVLAMTDEEKERRKQLEDKHKKLKYQHDLIDQVEANKKRIYDEQIEKLRAKEKVENSVRSYEEEMQLTKRKQDEKLRKEREVRMAQIEENKTIKERERQLRIAQEKADMLRAKKRAEQEEEMKLRKKEKEKEAQERLLIENLKNRQLKEKQLLERQEQDKKMNRDYEAKLEREEQARANAFRKRVDALNAFNQSYEESVGSKIKDQKKEEERILMQNLQDKANEDARKLKARDDKRKNDLIESTKFNLNMIERKKEEKSRERQEAVERRWNSEREALELQKKEQEKNELRKQKMLEMKSTLDQQVSQKKTMENGITLSKTEIIMNKSIIEKLERDPQLRSKVVERLKPTSSNVNTKKSNIF